MSTPMDADMTASSQSSTGSTSTSTNDDDECEAKITKQTNNTDDRTEQSTPDNPCLLCFSEEKQLACLPCGHLSTCVACGHSVKSCPICRREIEAFVRIYT